MEMAQKQVFRQRRQALFAQLPADSIALVPTTSQVIRSHDTHYPFRPDSNFYYLTGFCEPDAIAVFIKIGTDECRFLLFNQERDPALETWTGKRLGQLAASVELGADEAFPINSFAKLLPKLLRGKQTIYFPIGENQQFDQQLIAAVNKLIADTRSSVSTPQQLANINPLIHELRLFKSEYELALMQTAAAISVAAHLRTMRYCQVGQYEYQLEAEFMHEIAQRGARYPAYESIVAAGVNACTLHYVNNNARIEDGDLVLLDAGAEYNFYAADITRTFPANGRFSDEQRAVYDIVLEAQIAVIAAVKPGICFADLNQIACEQLARGLLDLGLLQGSLQAILEKKLYRKFYMHGVSHWLGLDVHDVGSYKVDGDWRVLAAGMVHTVEPGIYIEPGCDGVDEKWWGIGVRIEDDVLVTSQGHEVLTIALPKLADDVEAVMQ